MKIHDRLAADLPAKVPVDMVVIDDPYEIGGKIRAFRSLRDDPVAAMQSAGQLGDHHLAAARHWQRAFELVEIGGARAIDPTKEAVDGGRRPDLLCSEPRARAVQELAKASLTLGRDGEALVRDVLGCGLNIRDAALKRGFIGREEIRGINNRFVECLQALSICFGYTTERK